MKKQVVKVAVIQEEIALASVEDMIAKISECMKQCSSNNVDIVCLSEYCIAGLRKKDGFIDREFYENAIPQIMSFICNTAKLYNMYIAFGMIREENLKYYNSGILVNRNGEIVLTQNKHLLNSEEQEVICAANTTEVCDTELGKVGILLGNDINSFQICAELIKQNVEIVISLTQIPEYFSNALKRVSTARTIDMDAFVILACNTGSIQTPYFKMGFNGISRILANPLLHNQEDYIIGKADNCPEIIYGNLNVAVLREKRVFAIRPNYFEGCAETIKYIVESSECVLAKAYKTIIKYILSARNKSINRELIIDYYPKVFQEKLRNVLSSMILNHSAYYIGDYDSENEIDIVIQYLNSLFKEGKISNFEYGESYIAKKVYKTEGRWLSFRYEDQAVELFTYKSNSSWNTYKNVEKFSLISHYAWEIKKSEFYKVLMRAKYGSNMKVIYAKKNDELGHTYAHILLENSQLIEVMLKKEM